MSIERIHIENFKSIKKCDLLMNNLSFIIGENGTGKTNLLEAIKYFYDNMTDSHIRNDIFDMKNKYRNETRITIYFNLNKVLNTLRHFTKYNMYDEDNQSASTDTYRGYYKKIYQMTGNEKILTLEMRQIKNKGITWNYKYEDRFIIKSLFPLFYVDTRKVNITEWNAIWDIIGDLCKVSNAERRELESELKKLISLDTRKISKKFQKIESLLRDAKVNVAKATSQAFAKSLAQIYFDGSVFINEGKGLKFFSNGTNSVNYIKLLMKTIYQIAEMKLKQPILIIDEPEIHLHHQFIDELAEELPNNMERYQLIVATHSARLVKDVIQAETYAQVFNVRLINGYSEISLMKMFTEMDNRAKYIVSDEYANAYFSQAMILVEGETELELFSNPYLRLLFPELKYIDVYKALSNNVIRDLIHPNKMKMRTPFLLIIDMDKAIGYNPARNAFRIETYLKENETVKKEAFLINQKNNHARQNVYVLRKRILAMTEQCRFHRFQPFYSCNDRNFIEYIHAIKTYLLHYNTFVCSTTAEGLIITRQSRESVFQFTKSRKRESAFQRFAELYQQLPTTDQVNALRLLYDGKSDLLVNLYSTELSQQEKYIFSQNKTKKASGWISAYLEYYLLTYAQSFQPNCTNYKKFSSLIKEETVYDAICRDFAFRFPELQHIITLSKKMINDTI